MSYQKFECFAHKTKSCHAGGAPEAIINADFEVAVRIRPLDPECDHATAMADARGFLRGSDGN